MAVFANDTFTDTGGTYIELQTHTSDSGHTWDIGNGNLDIRTADNVLTADSNAGNSYIYTAINSTPPSADYKTSMDVTVKSTNDFTAAAVMARVTGVGSNSGYALALDPNLGIVTLQDISAGSRTDIGTPFSIDLSALPVTYKLTVECIGTSIKGYVDDIERCSDTNSTHTATGKAGIYMRYASADSDLEADNFVAETAGAAGPTLDPVPTTAFPGQSRTLTGSGFGATQGTGGVTIGGVAQTISSWADTSITITTVLGGNSYGSGKTIEVTTDAATTASDTIELVADTAGGFGYVTLSSPNTSDESSVCFGATPTPVTGDQFEWEDFNALGSLVIDAEGFVQSVDTEGDFRGRFWDATDQTWGAVETFTASTGDGWLFGKGISYAASKTWTWGKRHPLTSMRVRIFK